MGWVQRILDALGGGGPTQHQRLLRLHTPLGPEVLLAERAEVVEAIGPEGDAEAPAGFRLHITALSTDAHLGLQDLVGRPVLLELLTAASRTALRPWHGHVTRFGLLGSDGGLARYELVVEPWLAFLRWRQDAFVFQDMSVPQIVDAVFARYQGQGTLVPAWRWELADAAVYPRRSLAIQYHESDLGFVSRLLAEEGLFWWFEHEGDAAGEALGTHTLVIADHNGAFKPAATPQVRYTQSGSASFSEDGLQRWQRARQLRTHGVELASYDYRSLGLREVSASAEGAGDVPLVAVDVPGVYAYEDSAQGQRLAQRWLEALQSGTEQWTGEGTVRGLAPGTTLRVQEHSDADPGPFVALKLVHRARNNLGADSQAQLQRWLGDAPAWARAGQRLGNASEEPLYRVQLTAQRSSVPVRATAGVAGLLPRPTVHGTQTALVVGLDAPVHTDRDHRVKIQFHWQRGAMSSHGLEADGDDNAPATDAAGTWVRVSELLAGANWGSHFIPRLGQEVVVSFVEGDIDRPVVTGAVYNGVGAENAQGNTVLAGNAGATGNAAAWFPGTQAQGALQGHRHNAVLSGYKSQELQSSTSGTGGYNQWVLDDTPQAHRIELSSTTAATRLQLGHLLMQRDNQRLQPRGHGFDLATSAYGALRAGSGMLLSAHGRQPSISATKQMDSREPQAVLQTAQELARTLADSSQKHQAQQVGEPEPKKLAVSLAQAGLFESLQAVEGSDAADDGDATRIGGGLGRYPVLGRPDLVMAAPGGIGSFTPASLVVSAGHTTSLVAGQDITLTAQRHHAVVVKNGLVWFTYGKAQNANKPNTETGIALHAATGSVSVQAASAKSLWTADKKVEVASTGDAVTVGSPQHVLFNGGGSSVRITNGNITLTTQGPAVFKAAVKELTGAASAEAQLQMPKPPSLKGCAEALKAAAGSGAALA
jgi:type VI secretion system secreted protein VgrG